MPIGTAIVLPVDQMRAPESTQTAKTVVMYWRPGCGFCSVLERQMTRRELSFEMRNIWDDPAAAEFVRSVARGREVVPTLTIGNAALVNPSIDEVLAVLSA